MRFTLGFLLLGAAYGAYILVRKLLQRGSERRQRDLRSRKASETRAAKDLQDFQKLARKLTGDPNAGAPMLPRQRRASHAVSNFDPDLPTPPSAGRAEA